MTTTDVHGRERNSRILVVEDDEALGDLLREELSERGHEVVVTGSAETAAGVVEQRRIDLVLSDLRLPGSDGLQLLHHVRSSGIDAGFVVVTAFGTIEQAVDALKRGADDFLTKPLNLFHLDVVVNRVIENHRLRRRLREMEACLDTGDFHGLVGRSAPMRRLFDVVRRVARGEGPVLVVGESGTGKELLARAVHDQSARGDGPFVPVNCAGVPAELLESEFFGHVRGAFTGAQERRSGLFQQAQGGTLFLDEIAEMPIELQAKLLRVLQDGRVRPVGSDREQAVDVRVLAATNQDIEASVDSGGFRADLFYRLDTFRVDVPPLRDRGEDLDLLAARFVSRFAQRSGKAVKGIDADALAALHGYAFPGNVRELENAMERAVTFVDGPQIRLKDLPQRICRSRRAAGSTLSGEEAVGDGHWPTLDEMTGDYVRRVLSHTGGNKRRAASILGIGRRTLYRRLEE